MQEKFLFQSIPREKFRQDLRMSTAIAFYEYLLIILPVGLYVLLEAWQRPDCLTNIQSPDWTLLYQSPEWSIATIFIAFNSFSILSKTLQELNLRPTPFVRIIALVGILIIAFALLNADHSMHLDNNGKRDGNITFNWASRLILFIIISIIFFFIVSFSKVLKLNRKQE